MASVHGIERSISPNTFGGSRWCTDEKRPSTYRSLLDFKRQEPSPEATVTSRASSGRLTHSSEACDARKADAISAFGNFACSISTRSASLNW